MCRLGLSTTHPGRLPSKMFCPPHEESMPPRHGTHHLDIDMMRLVKKERLKITLVCEGCGTNTYYNKYVEVGYVRIAYPLIFHTHI